MKCPTYLSQHLDAFRADPHQANLEWFKRAKFGLFIHWGLYAYYGENCPYIFKNDVPIPEYRRAMDEFTGEKFDADFITDLALDAEMTYVTLVTRHHDSFSLWDSQSSEFARGYCSPAAPARRDFVGELAEQCAAKGLAFFLYYSYGLDWVHPAFPTEESGIVRAPKRVDGYHTWQEGSGNDEYVQFMHGQITELLTNYGHIAGMWFDPVSSVYQRPDLFPLEDTYALVRKLQPHCLIAFKNGATGTEDYITPEVRISDGGLQWLEKGCASEDYKSRIRAFWDHMVADGVKEFCGRLEKSGWGYVKDTERIDADEVMRRLAYANDQNSNMLLNTGPLFNGSIHPAAVATLRETGARIRRDGWPGGSGVVQESVLTVE